MNLTVNRFIPQNLNVNKNSCEFKPNYLTKPLQTDTVSFGNATEWKKLGDFVLKHTELGMNITKKGVTQIGYFSVEKINNPPVQRFKELLNPLMKLLDRVEDNTITCNHLETYLKDQLTAMRTMALCEQLLPDQFRIMTFSRMVNLLDYRDLLDLKGNFNELLEIIPLEILTKRINKKFDTIMSADFDYLQLIRLDKKLYN